MDGENSLDIKEFWEIIRKRRILIITVTLAITVITALVSMFVIKPTYESDVSIIVGKPETKDNSSAQYQDVMMYQNLIKTYSEIAKSTLVANDTASRLNNSIKGTAIQSMVTVTSETGTQILSIKAKSKDKKQAYELADAFSQSFIDNAKSVFPTGGDIQIMDKPQLPNKPVSPKKTLNCAIAFLIGLMGTVGVSFLMEFMDSTLKSEEDIERYLGIPVIGIVPRNLES